MCYDDALYKFTFYLLTYLLTWELLVWYFYKSDALPVTQSTVSKRWSKHSDRQDPRGVSMVFSYLVRALGTPAQAATVVGDMDAGDALSVQRTVTSGQTLLMTARPLIGRHAQLPVARSTNHAAPRRAYCQSINQSINQPLFLSSQSLQNFVEICNMYAIQMVIKWLQV